MRFILCVVCLSILIGCNSGQSGSNEVADPKGPGDSVAGYWVRACSSMDDRVTAELFSDAGLLPLWWVERLEVDFRGFKVVREIYSDDSCSTPLTSTDDAPLIVECQGTDRTSYLVQDTYEVTSFVYSDSSGFPDRPDTCDLPSEPALNIYPSGDVLYRAYYAANSTGESSGIFVDFNKAFERMN